MTRSCSPPSSAAAPASWCGSRDGAVHFTEGLIERLGIECEYEASGNVSAALSAGQLRRAEGIARVLSECGGEVEFVEGASAGLPHAFPGGIHERAGGVLNPGMFARGLREMVRGSAARVFERTPVEAVETGGSQVVLGVPGGRVRADRVLIAANAYARDLAFAPRRIVAPLWVTLAETEPIEPSRLEATGWTGRAGIYTQHVILESYRPTARDTIVFGSRLPQTPRGPLGARQPDPRVTADVVRGFHERFPTLRDVPMRRSWGGWIAMTPSWIPVAGEASPRILYAVGYNGHGLAQAPYVGTLVADRLAGDELHDDLRVVWRQRPRFAPAPLFTAPALRAGWAIDRVSDRFAARRG